MENLKSMTVVLAILGALITAFGALIAYFQWRTAHQRVVLDLFDRRVAIVNEIEAAAKEILNAVAGAQMEKPFWSFVAAESKARFLFGADVINKLADLRADLAAAMSFSGIDPGSPNFEALTDRKYKALQSLAGFLQNESAALFAPYIRLDQKMPGLWWPL
jgi:hypothetical protein